jgi:hypothetical protein
MNTTERRAFALQFAAATLYAAALAPAAWLARQAPTRWTQYERWVLRGFATAAGPITVWQIGVKLGWWR